MTNKDEKYDALIRKLRNAKPLAEDAELLTDQIMKAVGQLNHRSPQRIIFWVRPLLTAAALFLFGLFLYQSDEGVVSRQTGANFKPVKFEFFNNDYCGPGTTLNIRDQQSLKEHYLCYLKSGRFETGESKEFYMNFITRVQKTEDQ